MKVVYIFSESLGIVDCEVLFNYMQKINVFRT